MVEYRDTSEYSDDSRYRWWYERRWDDGPALCWVGLNPSTGDSTGRPRPTLRKVVALAQSRDLSAVIVVNLFAWRATRPRDLRNAATDHDIIGARNDLIITSTSHAAALTLAAWGAHGRLFNRGAAVMKLLDRPACLGVTARGEPRHPLYVAAGVGIQPYVRS